MKRTARHSAWKSNDTDHHDQGLITSSTSPAAASQAAFLPGRYFCGKFAGPEESHHFRADHPGVLHPQQPHPAGRYPVQHRQRPHDELAMILPESEIPDRVVRVEIAMRNEVPGLLVLREVWREREPAVEQQAPGAETEKLQAQHEQPDPPDRAQEIMRPGVSARRATLVGGQGRSSPGGPEGG